MRAMSFKWICSGRHIKLTRLCWAAVWISKTYLTFSQCAFERYPPPEWAQFCSQGGEGLSSTHLCCIYRVEKHQNKLGEKVVYFTRPAFRRAVTAPGRTSTALDGILFSWSKAFVVNSLRFGAPCTKGRMESWYSRSGFSWRILSSFGRHSGQSISISAFRTIYFTPVSCTQVPAVRKTGSKYIYIFANSTNS